MLTDDRIKELWNASAKFINGYGQVEILQFARAIEAEASPASVPEGYAIVPVEPTEEMMRAMTDPFIPVNGNTRKAFYWAYPRMLAAAPTPPVSEDRKDAPQEDYFADACRLALELECLLLDCKDTAVTAKWWDSAHEALEQHRERLAAMQGDKP